VPADHRSRLVADAMATTGSKAADLAAGAKQAFKGIVSHTQSFVHKQQEKVRLRIAAASPCLRQTLCQAAAVMPQPDAPVQPCAPSCNNCRQTMRMLHALTRTRAVAGPVEEWLRLARGSSYCQTCHPSTQAHHINT
jgi:hypothetical protein